MLQWRVEGVGETDHIRALFVQTPAALTGHLAGMLMLAGIYLPVAPLPHVLGWLGAAFLVWLLRLLHFLRMLPQGAGNPAQVHAWRRSWRPLVLANGAVWGTAAWLFWGLATPYHDVALISVVYGFSLASVQLLSTQLPVFLGFNGLVLLPLVARIATDTRQPWHMELALIQLAAFLLVMLMGRTYGTALGQAIALRAHTDDLARRLLVQKGVAEEARRAAEAANRAKTQFFAAASHDLRQPLHAMGLFAEALRQRSRDPEVASLVDSINESVDALEGLFGELLDITRIDTGGVDVKPLALSMNEMFARLRLNFEPTAFEKGLMLSFRGGRHVAHADPLLLERILRNLVSNAIRYCDDGGVLVSCRPRAGKLLLQVWDSGIGISAASLPHIWDEFFQAQGNRPLEPHQRKGLGLGLAIVKRLAALMDTPVSVRSRVGHGTVFSIELPMGTLAPRAPGSPAAMPRPLGLTLEGRSVLVLEDEPQVREGLVVLLQAWGAQVRAFDSVALLSDWLTDPDAQRPDLLMLDYRLPEGRTGVEALALLRARWPEPRLPAIVITGSSMGGHEAEAVANDYHMLIKPVLPAKLRAMIAFKLGARR